MFKFLKDFFHFSNSEMKGIFVLLILIVLVFLIPRIYFYYKPAEIVDNTEFELWVDEINRKDSLQEKELTRVLTEIKYFNFDPNEVTYLEMKKLGFDSKTASIFIKYRNKGAKFYSKKDLLKIYGFSEELYSKLENYIQFPVKKQKQFSKKNNKISTIEYFPFDPNTVSYSDMKKLGISGKTANILIKFRKDKTVFYSKEDLLKVYGFTEEKYEELKDLIQFPKKESTKEFKPKTTYNDTVIVHINYATYSEFIKLKGIGAYRAKQIIELRTKLGGFYSKTQLKEIYGITDEVFAQFEKNIKVSITNIKKIDLNTATFKILIRHPYIDKKQTNAILKLRKELGGFTKIKDLIYYNTLKQEDFDKIKWYLKVE